jgi:4a-hydroxytetrahydrobiopterin dehydratase
MPLIEPEVITDSLQGLEDGWAVEDDALVRVVELTDEQHATVQQRVMDTANAMNHHPDISRDGARTRFVLSTHSAGGITELDFTLAAEIDSAVRDGTGAPPPALPDEVVGTYAVSHSADEAVEASSSDEGRPAEEYMGQPAGAQGTPAVPLPDTAPGEPEPGEPWEQEPRR